MDGPDGEPFQSLVVVSSSTMTATKAVPTTPISARSTWQFNIRHLPPSFQTSPVYDKPQTCNDAVIARVTKVERRKTNCALRSAEVMAQRRAFLLHAPAVFVRARAGDRQTARDRRTVPVYRHRDGTNVIRQRSRIKNKRRSTAKNIDFGIL